jgi:hypothetical protein
MGIVLSETLRPRCVRGGGGSGGLCAGKTAKGGVSGAGRCRRQAPTAIKRREPPVVLAQRASVLEVKRLTGHCCKAADHNSMAR